MNGFKDSKYKEFKERNVIFSPVNQDTVSVPIQNSTIPQPKSATTKVESISYLVEPTHMPIIYGTLDKYEEHIE